MRNRVQIEDIEEMRCQEGIDDAELRAKVRGLGIGDFVRLTLLTGLKSFAGETLLVRITSIRGCAFRGKLASRPASPGLSDLRIGSPVVFTTAHIHSLPGRQPAREGWCPEDAPCCDGASPVEAVHPRADRRPSRRPPPCPASSLIGPGAEGLPVIAKVKAAAPSATPRSGAEQLAGSQPALPRTTEECLQRIAAMGQRINGYIEFMCGVGSLHGSSAEAKEKAVLAFHEHLVALERELGRIQEELRLG